MLRLATPTSEPHLSAHDGTDVGVGVVATAAWTSARRTSARQSGPRVLSEGQVIAEVAVLREREWGRAGGGGAAQAAVQNLK